MSGRSAHADFRDGLEIKVCVTAQHRAMLDQVLECFEVRPDYDLDLMTPGQTLAQITARAISALDPLLARSSRSWPWCKVTPPPPWPAPWQRSTARIPVAHVEAGLPHRRPGQPFPEEMNRLVTGRLAALHFAPYRGRPPQSAGGRRSRRARSW